jgi:hypothetical protein
VPSDGKRRPPRPRIEVISPSASPQEAAAIAAAIERFLAETSPASAPESAPSVSAWQRAALEEGVSARQALGSAWGR